MENENFPELRTETASLLEFRGEPTGRRNRRNGE